MVTESEEKSLGLRHKGTIEPQLITFIISRLASNGERRDFAIRGIFKGKVKFDIQDSSINIFKPKTMGNFKLIIESQDININQIGIGYQLSEEAKYEQ